jgi:hypothetical protein
MSRNVRQKYPRTPVKASKRRGSDSSSSPNLSDDDDGYSGVEDVSDSDEDDEDYVEAAEEEHIITETRKRPSVLPRPVQEEDEDADEEDDDDQDDDDDGEEHARDGDENGAGDSASWDGFVSDREDTPGSGHAAPNVVLEQEPVSAKQVRFIGVPDIESDSDSTTTDTSEDIHDTFPDLFVEQSALDPAFRREIENDETSSNSSFWDFNNPHDLGPGVVDNGLSEDETPTATPNVSRAATVAPFGDGAVSEASTPVPSDPDGYESEYT